MSSPAAPPRGKPLILTVNGGSSSIKFAVFEGGDPLRSAASVRP
jgi:butyrate kinase